MVGRMAAGARAPVGADHAVALGRRMKFSRKFCPLGGVCGVPMISEKSMYSNFWPVSGSVTYSHYYPGEHFLAFKPKASEENEHTCTAIRTPEGQDVFFKQIAGGFARRIVCYAQSGLQVAAGEQCGIIRFGSRIDIFLPVDAEILVRPGDQVRACETIIAKL